MPTNDAASEMVALDLHDLYENAPCGYHSVGRDGTILRINQTELTWLGFTQQELVGKRNFAELISARCCSEYKRARSTRHRPRNLRDRARTVPQRRLDV